MLSAVVGPVCVWLVLFVFVVGVVFAAELPPFFFAFAVDVVCAMAIDPIIKNALIQKLTANFKYLFIVVLSRSFYSAASSTPTPTHPVDTTSAAPHPWGCGPPHAVIQTMYSYLLRQI